jgi:hypothetical protein
MFRGAAVAEIVVALLVLTPSLLLETVQKRPSFAGQWSLKGNPKPEVADLGPQLAINENSESLTIVHVTSVPAGRGSSRDATTQQKVRSYYRFDGTETNVSVIAFDLAQSRRFDTASWEGNRLVVLTKWRSSAGVVSTVRRQVFSLEADDTLIVETEQLNNGTSAGVAKTYYQRTTRTASRAGVVAVSPSAH